MWVLINKFASPNKDIIVKPKKCKDCNALITETNKVRKHGSVGYYSNCRKCINKRNLEYVRKRAKIIKDNPLW